MHRRREVWDLLAGAWELESLASVRETISLAELADKIEQLLAGNNVGRTIVDIRR
jgi:hypothetical protein